MAVEISERSKFIDSNWETFFEQIEKFVEEKFPEKKIVIFFNCDYHDDDLETIKIVFETKSSSLDGMNYYWWTPNGLSLYTLKEKEKIIIIRSLRTNPILDLSTVIGEHGLLQGMRILEDPTKTGSSQGDKSLVSRKNYIQEVSKRFTKNLSETKKNIERGKTEIQNLQQELVRKIREVQGLESKLTQIQSCEGEELEKFGKEYDMLLQVPKVKAVEVADGVIKVFTEMIFCQDDRDGLWHEIGEFRIEIYTSGANNGVRWFNLTGKLEGSGYGTHAPHVDESGKACLGNTSSTFPELIGAYEFAAVAMLAIEFVSSCNTDDSAGRNISKFPLAFGDGRKP